MKKPFLHALGAALYIVGIVFVVQAVTTTLKGYNQSILIPMTMLSLFVLSAAVMGYLFLSESIYLLMENKKHEAVVFFAKVVGIFAGFALILTALLFVVNPKKVTPEISNQKLNINDVCENAITYMTFTDGVNADQYVAECKEGKHPEVIEHFKAQMNLGDGAVI